jgi:hypothetical protein
MTFESWRLHTRRGQVVAVSVDGVELSRAEWEADGDRLYLRKQVATTSRRIAVTAVMSRAGASYVVDAELASPSTVQVGAL